MNKLTNMSKEEIATNGLNSYLNSNQTITTLDFKNHLITTQPQIIWTQQWVSSFLSKFNFPYTTRQNKNGDTYRVYTLVTAAKDHKTLLLDAANTFGRPFNKFELWAKLNLGPVSFNEAFKRCNFVRAGDKSGLKLYMVSKDGQHFSVNANKYVEIKDMTKPHILNTLVKKNLRLSEVLKSPDSEAFQLLNAFFTHDLRSMLK